MNIWGVKLSPHWDMNSNEFPLLCSTLLCYTRSGWLLFHTGHTDLVYVCATLIWWMFYSSVLYKQSGCLLFHTPHWAHMIWWMFLPTLCSTLPRSAIQWSHFVKHCGRTFHCDTSHCVTSQMSNVSSYLQIALFCPIWAARILTTMVRQSAWTHLWILVAQFLF